MEVRSFSLRRDDRIKGRRQLKRAPPEWLRKRDRKAGPSRMAVMQAGKLDCDPTLHSVLSTFPDHADAPIRKGNLGGCIPGHPLQTAMEIRC